MESCEGSEILKAMGQQFADLTLYITGLRDSLIRHLVDPNTLAAVERYEHELSLINEAITPELEKMDQDARTEQMDREARRLAKERFDVADFDALPPNEQENLRLYALALSDYAIPAPPEVSAAHEVIDDLDEKIQSTFSSIELPWSRENKTITFTFSSIQPNQLKLIYTGSYPQFAIKLILTFENNLVIENVSIPLGSKEVDGWESPASPKLISDVLEALEKVKQMLEELSNQ